MSLSPPWSTNVRLQSAGMSLREAYDFRTAQLIDLLEAVEAARRELACLIPVPSDPEVAEWPCENPADRDCLHTAYTTLQGASNAAFARAVAKGAL